MAIKPLTPFSKPETLLADLIKKQANPYPGLRPFHGHEDWLFFGRERHTVELLDILANAHFVSAIGPSGCGKSSLIRAGVLPALEKGYAPKAGSLWKSAKMRPGTSPFGNLTDALIKATRAPGKSGEISPVERGVNKMRLSGGRDGVQAFFAANPLPEGYRLVLLLDQFEELFRSTKHSRKANEVFVAMLVELFENPIEDLYIIMTMRTDYIGDCTRFVGLAEIVNDSFYLISRLTLEELRKAIERPAVTVGGRIEPKLVERLLDTAPDIADMETESDHLPLMQHALMWMWQRRTEARRSETGKEPATDAAQPVVVGLEDYDEIGGLELALGRHADQQLNRLCPDSENQQRVLDVTAALFRQLVECHDYRFIRRPTTVGQVIEASRPDAADSQQPPPKPLIRIEELIPVIQRFSDDDCSFLYAKKGAGDAITQATELDLGHEALIRQWRTLREWATDEADAGRQLIKLAEQAPDSRSRKSKQSTGSKAASVNKGARTYETLSRLKLSNFRKNWRETQRLYAGQEETRDEDKYLFERMFGWVGPYWDKFATLVSPHCRFVCRPFVALFKTARKSLALASQALRETLAHNLPQPLASYFVTVRDDIPNRNWALRYLAPLADRHGRDVDGLYRDTKRYWDESKQDLRRRKILAAVLPFGTFAVLLLWGLYSYTANDAEANMADYYGYIIESAVLAQGGKQHNVEQFRRLLDSHAAPKLRGLLLGWPFFDSVDDLRRRYANTHHLFSVFADLYSVELADPQSSKEKAWGRLKRRNPHVQITDAIHLRPAGFEDCIAAIDASGQLAATCKTRAGGSNGLIKEVVDPVDLDGQEPANAAVARVASLFEKGPETEAEKDRMNTAIRTALLAVRSSGTDPEPRLIAVSPSLSVNACTLTPNESQDPALGCEFITRIPEFSDAQDQQWLLRNVALDPTGNHVAAIYRHSGYQDWTQDINPFQVTLFDLTNGGRAIAGPTVLKTAKVCNWPTDAEFANLRIPDAANQGVRLSVLFDNNTFCQWRFTLATLSDAPTVSTTSPVEPSARHLTQGQKNTQFDVARDGDKALLGFGHHFVVWPDPEADRAADEILTARLYDTGFVSALRVFDRDRILSSSSLGRAYVSHFALRMPVLRLTTDNSRIIAFAPDAKNEVAYGVTDRDQILKWDLGSKKSTAYFVLDDADESPIANRPCGHNKPSSDADAQRLATAIQKHRHARSNGDEPPCIDVERQQRRDFCLAIEGVPEDADACKEEGESKRAKEAMPKLYEEEPDLVQTIQSLHRLPWSNDETQDRQYIIVNTRGDAFFYNREPLKRMFKLSPAMDIDIRSNQFSFDESQFDCAAEDNPDLTGCWLSLRFKPKASGKGPKTVVYHFPKLVTGNNK